jgi:hypothetical protein
LIYWGQGKGSQTTRLLASLMDCFAFCFFVFLICAHRRGSEGGRAHPAKGVSSKTFYRVGRSVVVTQRYGYKSLAQRPVYVWALLNCPYTQLSIQTPSMMVSRLVSRGLSLTETDADTRRSSFPHVGCLTSGQPGVPFLSPLRRVPTPVVLRLSQCTLQAACPTSREGGEIFVFRFFLEPQLVFDWSPRFRSTRQGDRNSITRKNRHSDLGGRAQRRCTR